MRRDTDGEVLLDGIEPAARRIYAAGHVCLPHKFNDTADASARIVVQNALFGGRQRLSGLTIPWCTIPTRRSPMSAFACGRRASGTFR
jgi:pyruvate/2-oxoglutarate dehydrogenase complex dihydrolipoamide dehydrogenase (E3) component